MSLTLKSPPFSALSSSLQGRSRFLPGAGSTASNQVLFNNVRKSFPLIRASSSSLDTGSNTELDAVSSFSEIVPDTVIFDDFERFPPTAATVSSSLLLGICSLPDTVFRNAVEMALADSTCYGLENADLRLSCFVNKALVNVGGDLAKLVPGRTCISFFVNMHKSPLTSLRDNLIVTLQDADGVKISHAGVEIKSIVEKGLWDDLFPLEGGGHVHMKLQFVLSEEERSQIRMMNDAERYEEISSIISVPQGVDVHLSHKELVEKNESKSLPADFPTEAISSNETSLLLGGSRLDVAASNNSLPHNLGEDSGHNIQKQSQIGKSPRNVKYMISAFESGLAQDTRSPIKSPPTRSQTTELQHTPTDIRKRGEQINLLGASDRSKLSQDTGQLEELNTQKFQILRTNSSLKNKFNVVHKEVTREEEKSHQDLMRISTSEMATVSWRILDEYSGGRPLSLFTGKQDSCGNPVIEESRREIQFTNLQEFNIQGASTHKLESVHYCEDNHYLFKSSGAWIFPDEARRLCVTTGGKKVMDLMEGCSPKPKVHQGNVNLSMQENMEKHSVDARTVSKADKDKKDCHKIGKSKPENSEDIETSGGPVGQAIKVAIMLGFGILVLLTRKRNYR